ncbi:hypothetical protein SKAU_G00270210 [Synaphobranchus kaupii]|uniref:Uncharacterized protein n=1 Tax=Synaphobranchus kaupii TaxID=118154 RepID=A0A9Q1F048_SYNKA|nr:hypothetical protein SKAU_G00270210 [Synaphobranchus kaupii]
MKPMASRVRGTQQENLPSCVNKGAVGLLPARGAHAGRHAAQLLRDLPSSSIRASLSGREMSGGGEKKKQARRRIAWTTRSSPAIAMATGASLPASRVVRVEEGETESGKVASSTVLPHVRGHTEQECPTGTKVKITSASQGLRRESEEGVTSSSSSSPSRGRKGERTCPPVSTSIRNPPRTEHGSSQGTGP